MRRRIERRGRPWCPACSGRGRHGPREGSWSSGLLLEDDGVLVDGLDCRREKWLEAVDELLAHEGGVVIWEELEVGGAWGRGSNGWLGLQIKEGLWIWIGRIPRGN